MAEAPKNKPIKRHKAIQPLSREHHQGLLLCWKIGKGFEKDIEPERMMNYLAWFWENHLKLHFEIEEKYVFPVLGENHELVEQALEEHEHLKYLFQVKEGLADNLKTVRRDLEAHIRFEERILFNEVQKIASEEDFQKLKEHHDEEISCGLYQDEFWI
ncbi:MAG TPA: hemerythrin domain-containing protein [Salegentibacter sp.]|uniref:hemerythrin domain-containing protein n=1 Tax=Salegentibacter sp. TaxID=1903072 RepID=UPI002F91E515